MKCPVRNTHTLSHREPRATQPAHWQAGPRKAVAFLLTTLLMASCSASRLAHTASEHVRTDSTFTAAAAKELHRQQASAARRQQQEWQTTTLVTSEEEVPAAEAAVTLPMQGLLTLPEGAGYTTGNGRTSVSVTRHGDSLIVRGRSQAIARKNIRIAQAAYGAVCASDSLDQTITRHTDSLTTAHTSAAQTHREVQKKTTRSGWPCIILWMLSGAALFMLLRRPRIINAAWSAIKGLFA